MKKFEQMKKLYQTLEGYIDQYDTSEVSISGTAADFDRLFELSWKTIKEFLQKEKMMYEARTGSPRDIIKLAFREGMISDEKMWIKMLKDRNDDSHIYLKADAILYVSRIQSEYLPVIKKLIDKLNGLIAPEPLEEIQMPSSLIDYCRKNNLDTAGFVDEIIERFGFETRLMLYEHWEEIRKSL